MKDKIIIKQGGGPFTGVAYMYRWDSKGWLYCHHSHDSVPSSITPGAQTDVTEMERPISMGEASDLLRRCGLTEEDVPLVKVASTLPETLDDIASKKQNKGIIFHFYEVVEACPYQDQWPYLQEVPSAPEDGISYETLGIPGGIPRDIIAVREMAKVGYAVTKNRVSDWVHQFLRELYGLPIDSSRIFRPVLLKPKQELREFKEKPGWTPDCSRQYIDYRGEISEGDLTLIERYVRVNRMPTFNSLF